MTRKNAQFGLDSLLGYFVFALFLIFTLMALTLSGCGSGKNRVERGLDTEKGVLGGLRASEQLSAYLATEIPEKGMLYERIGESEHMFSAGTIFNSEKAKEFLDNHPEVYVGKTYGGFISALYAYRSDGKVKDAFDGVTKALFYRQLASKSKKDTDEGRLFGGRYFSPIVSVGYGRDKHGGEDWLLSYGLGFGLAKNYAIRTLPTHDKTGVTVKLQVYEDDLSEPLP